MSPRCFPAPTRGTGRAGRAAAGAADGGDQRLHAAGGLRRQFDKVFPTHWSFLLGEVALYQGSYADLRGVPVSQGLGGDPDRRTGGAGRADG